MWLDSEIEFLRNNHNTMTYKEISSVIHKTPSCVGSMCHKLNLLKKQRTLWSDDDIAYLIQNYQTKTCADIADILHKTTRAVQHKYSELGLRRISNKPMSVFVGQKINCLEVLDIPYSVPVGRAKKIKWKVKCCCQCGKTLDMWLNSLLEGKQKSCGCVGRKVQSILCKYRNRKYTPGIIKHGLYRQWERIKNDCVAEWLSYESFYDWGVSLYKDKYSVVKVDATKPYGPDNTIFDIISKRSSIPEREIKQYMQSCGFTFKKNRTLLNGLEIDLYNPELKLGIEYCGLYWHCEESKRFRNAHYSKYAALEKLGIRLITVFGDEWDERRPQVENFLASVVGYQTLRVFGRLCEVRQIHTNTANDFIEANHIQGSKHAVFYAGLFYKNELIGCMSLAKHHRGNDCLVLDRMCFKTGVSVVGGASKMLKTCVEWAVRHGHSNIISWSDNRWSQGNVYQKLGFVLDGELGPDYSYVVLSNGRQRVSKQSMMKSKTGCPTDKTEKEWAEQNGYSRIWDCGKKRWVLSI